MHIRANMAKRRFSSELGLVLGILLTSFSVCMFLKSGFGVTVIASVPLAIQACIPSIPYGTWNIIYQSVIMLLAILILRQFRVSYIISLVVVVGFGSMINVFQPIVDLLPDSLTLHIAYFVFSMGVLSLGIGFLMRCHLPVLAADTLLRDYVEKYGTPFKKVKTVFDIICISTALLICALFLGELNGIGIGTIISALTTGYITSFVLRFYDDRFDFQPTFHVVRIFMEKYDRAIPLDHRNRSGERDGHRA